MNDLCILYCSTLIKTTIIKKESSLPWSKPPATGRQEPRRGSAMPEEPARNGNEKGKT